MCVCVCVCARACVYSFYFNNWVGWRCCVDRFAPNVIHDTLLATSIKLMVSGLLTWHMCYVRLI